MISALTNAPALSILLGALLVGLILGNTAWLGILAEAPRLPCLVIGTALVFIGARFTLQGLAGFRRSGTHVLPYKPALALVTDDIFARTRNPMYQGLGIAVVGLAVLLRIDGMIVLPLLVAPMIHYGLVLPEEGYLERKFGADYLRFKKQVPRYRWLFWPLVGKKPLTKDWLAWTAAAAALVIAAYTVPWLSDLVMQAVEDPGVRTAALSRGSVIGRSSLLAAAREAGLRPSPDVKGVSDGIRRIDDGQAKINGWAAEIGGNGSPLTILVFIDGSTTLETKTAGEHPGVARELNLSAEAARNVVFEGTLACRRRQKLIIVATTIGNKYAPLTTLICP